MLNEQDKQILYKAFQDALDLDTNRGVRMENGTILNSLFTRIVTMAGNEQSRQQESVELQKKSEAIVKLHADLEASKAEIQRLGEELLKARGQRLELTTPPPDGDA